MASAEAYMAGLNASLYPSVRQVNSPSTTLPVIPDGRDPSPSSIVSETKGKCHLLDLPKELRLLIWERYLQTVPTLVKLEQYHFVYKSRRYWQPLLSLANRQIRSELLPLFYRRCRFHLQGFNEDGDCEVELFLNRTLSYQALHQNMRIVVIHGFILHSGRWLGEFDLGKFTLNVDRHWKHSMEGEYSGMIEDLEAIFLWASQAVSPSDSREPVLRKLLNVMRARGVFLW